MRMSRPKLPAEAGDRQLPLPQPLYRVAESLMTHPLAVGRPKSLLPASGDVPLVQPNGDSAGCHAEHTLFFHRPPCGCKGLETAPGLP